MLRPVNDFVEQNGLSGALDPGLVLFHNEFHNQVFESLKLQFCLLWVLFETLFDKGAMAATIELSSNFDEVLDIIWELANSSGLEDGAGITDRIFVQERNQLEVIFMLIIIIVSQPATNSCITVKC